MNYRDYLRAFKSPLPKAVLTKWPGHIRQYWAENPALYSSSYGQTDPIHVHLAGHAGIDIATHHRDPVYAAHDGFVNKLDKNRYAAGGLSVWVESDVHDSEEPGNSKAITVYAHLDEYVVKEGDRIEQGQLLGYEGNTGFVISGGTPYWGNAPAGKGTHLHFGLYEFILKNGTWEPRYPNVLRNSSDPLPYISESAENPEGVLAGMAAAIANARKLLEYKFGKRSA